MHWLEEQILKCKKNYLQQKDENQVKKWHGLNLNCCSVVNKSGL